MAKYEYEIFPDPFHRAERVALMNRRAQDGWRFLRFAPNSEMIFERALAEPAPSPAPVKPITASPVTPIGRPKTK